MALGAWGEGDRQKGPKLALRFPLHQGSSAHHELAAETEQALSTAASQPGQTGAGRCGAVTQSKRLLSFLIP